MLTKRALITGISGQDGSYLADLLLEKGYEVHGIVRPKYLLDSMKYPENLAHIENRIQLHPGLLENHLSLSHAIREVKPDECYHLAGPSFVEASFVEEPSILMAHVNGTHALISSIKEIVPKCRFFQAGSSEMFGYATTSPQNEDTTFNPRSIYGLAKLSAYHVVRYYREKYGLFACTGILYNHESCRRSNEFVPRKVSSAVAKIKLGKMDKLCIGNLDAKRDWGYAPEYVQAMWRMLNAMMPDDYVIATGQTHTVRELIQIAFDVVGLDYEKYIDFDERFYRPIESVTLCGCSKKIKEKLGWQPKKKFNDIIHEMVMSDIDLLKNSS